jgi:GT2 family glycosyltransferase
MMTASPPPRMSVVVATRNRGGSVAATMESVLAGDYPDFDVWLVDQSDDDSTRRALRQVMTDARVNYVHSETRGVSTARNLGIALSRGELVAITDDDCVVPRDWLFRLGAAFSRSREIGIVFGNVVPEPHDPMRGAVPAYTRDRMVLVRSIREKNLAEGIAACMGIRRLAWQDLGGFDEMLGAGAKFASGAETDFTIRMLLAGYAVCETPEVFVVHRGFRSSGELRVLAYRYWFGTGATFAKHVKCRNGSVLGPLVRLAARWIVARSPVASSLGVEATRILRLRAFAGGFAGGLLQPVDRGTEQFRTPC